MIELGTEVTAPRRLYRRTTYTVKPTRKEWYSPEWHTRSITGIYIGFRTYKNGNMESVQDRGHEFTPTEWIKVALIVTNAREKPVPVLYSEMVRVNPERRLS